MGVRRAVGRWAVVAVGVPVTAKVADRLGQRIESRQGGPTRWSKGLRGGAARLRRLRSSRRRRG